MTHKGTDPECCIPGCHIPIAAGKGDWTVKPSGWDYAPSHICCYHSPKEMCFYLTCAIGEDSSGNLLVNDPISYDRVHVSCTNSEVSANLNDYHGTFGVCDTGIDFSADFITSGGESCFFALDFPELGISGTDYSKQIRLTGYERAFLCHRCDIHCATGCKRGGSDYKHMVNEPFITYGIYGENTIVNPCNPLVWTIESGDDPTADLNLGCLGCQTGVVVAVPKANVSVPRQRPCCRCEDAQTKDSYVKPCNPPCKPTSRNNDGFAKCDCISEHLCVTFISYEGTCMYTYSLPWEDWEFEPYKSGVVELSLQSGITCNSNLCPSGTGSASCADLFTLEFGAISGSTGCACTLVATWHEDTPYIPKRKEFVLGEAGAVGCPSVETNLIDYIISGAAPPYDWFFIDIRSRDCVDCNLSVKESTCCPPGLPRTLVATIECNEFCGCQSGDDFTLVWDEDRQDWYAYDILCDGHNLDISFNCNDSLSGTGTFGLGWSVTTAPCLTDSAIGTGTCSPINIVFSGISQNGIGCCGSDSFGTGTPLCTVIVTE